MIVVLSGTDGAGKSTQLRLLTEHLQSRGKRTRTLWHRPGYSWEAGLLKRLYRSIHPGGPPPGNSDARDAFLAKPRTGRLWITVACLDSLLQWAIKTRWWSLTGTVVLLDRYLDDGALDLEALFPGAAVTRGRFWRLVRWLSPRPHLRCLLLVSGEEGERRCGQKEDPFPVSPAVRRQREAAYAAMSQDGTWEVLDASPPADEVQRHLRALLDSRLSVEPLTAPEAS